MTHLTNSTELAPYACDPAKSRGRLFDEPLSATRTCFQRDKDRIVHSEAFRRLEYKTQVFVNHEGDFFRTRLTHSLEVSQISRSICRHLRLNEDLGEVLALAHDLGHPPFGHAGEDALKETMQPFGGFDHNAQSLSVITKLEERYPTFDGLNLTWETLEGIVKHNGPLTGPHTSLKNSQEGLPRVISQYCAQHDLELHTFASAEAQVAALSDDIAYNNHDIDDGLRAGLFSLNDLMDVPLVGPIYHTVRKEYPDLDIIRQKHETVRRMIGAMIVDVFEETNRRLKDAKPESETDVRLFSDSIVQFSDEMRKNDAAMKKFLFENMYRHYKLNRMTSKARRVVKDLFTLFLEEPECLPTEWQEKTGKPGDSDTAELVADYIAGMTDRLALDEHTRLFDMQARTS